MMLVVRLSPYSYLSHDYEVERPETSPVITFSCRAVSTCRRTRTAFCSVSSVACKSGVLERWTGGLPAGGRLD